jgi:hypothetical protein
MQRVLLRRKVRHGRGTALPIVLSFVLLAGRTVWRTNTGPLCGDIAIRASPRIGLMKQNNSGNADSFFASMKRGPTGKPVRPYGEYVAHPRGDFFKFSYLRRAESLAQGLL